MSASVQSQKGFTLIELMIVVAIIGILAAIAIPNFILYQLKSQQAEGRTNLAGVKTSQVAFNGEQGCYGCHFQNAWDGLHVCLLCVELRGLKVWGRAWNHCRHMPFKWQCNRVH